MMNKAEMYDYWVGRHKPTFTLGTRYAFMGGIESAKGRIRDIIASEPDLVKCKEKLIQECVPHEHDCFGD